mmetsp:Transcript_42781/g.100293  ORF Transcript_42781/g.100293 Transcript_42781/m.100293 type:complete len:165 (-) Transcript_42781:344-838(-)
MHMAPAACVRRRRVEVVASCMQGEAPSQRVEARDSASGAHHTLVVEDGEDDVDGDVEEPGAQVANIRVSPSRACPDVEGACQDDVVEACQDDVADAFRGEAGACMDVVGGGVQALLRVEHVHVVNEISLCRLPCRSAQCALPLPLAWQLLQHRSWTFLLLAPME